MAIQGYHLFIPALAFVLLSVDFTAAQIGVAYGRNGDGLPPPSQVVDIFKRYGIKRMRIYDPFPPTLQALGGSGIELTIGVDNVQLQSLNNRQNADNWVRDNIKNYPNVNFKHIVVGNEVSPIRNQQYVDFVVPAMRNVHDALVAAGLGGVKVSTAVETELIDPSKNFPPSKGEFRPEVKPYINSVLQFLVNTNGPLFVNIYPYFAYKYGNGRDITLQYALLQTGADTPDGHYDNLYYALVDTMYAAMEKTGIRSLSDSGVENTEIKGSESGWSSGGGSPPAADQSRPAATLADQNGGATPGNAEIYIRNLIRIVKSGTKKRPNRPIETYIFAAFDENRKPGDADEKNFGIFRPNGDTKFPINFN